MKKAVGRSSAADSFISYSVFQHLFDRHIPSITTGKFAKTEDFLQTCKKYRYLPPINADFKKFFKKS
jgi:hypothetical protein